MAAIRPKLHILLLAVLFPCIAAAQDNSGIPDAEKTLQFVYLAHDPIIPVDRITECLQRYYDNAMSSESYMVVFYMSNGDTPYIVQLNTPKDNRDDFSTLISALQSENYHRTNPVVDLERTVQIFNELDFVDPVTHNVTFSSVDWFFYVNSLFWQRRYNEEYISSLCFVMDVDCFSSSAFQIKFYYPKDDVISVDKNNPFGPKNYCNIRYYSYPY